MSPLYLQSSEKSRRLIMATKRIRTIRAAVEEIKSVDPKTAITENFIRDLVCSGKCPSFKAGKKYLIDLDVLFSILDFSESVDAK